MATVQLIPPVRGNTSITFDGRTYSSPPGIPIQVPDFDAAVLQANGWTVAQVAQSVARGASATTCTDLGPGLVYPFQFQATVNPSSPSSAVFPALEGELVYPLGAAAISGGGHLIGTLGRFYHNNTNTVGLGIGTEGKIDNTTTGTITTAISTDNNLGSNTGTITTWYGSYSDLSSNAGMITTAVGYGLNVEAANTGTIASYYGFYFPTLSAQNMTTTVIGYFFNNNPAVTALKLAIYVADPNAAIQTLGPIITTGKTTTATFQLDSGTKTATAVTGAATLNKASGKITSEALTTAAGASYTLTLTNSQIAAADTVFASIDNGTNSAGLPMVGRVTPGAGSATIVVNNMHATAAFNGTLVISFASLKA